MTIVITPPQSPIVQITTPQTSQQVIINRSNLHPIHGITHTADGIDPVFDQNLNTTDSVTFASISADNLGTMSGVDDAPSDDKDYARRNGAWSEVQSGSSFDQSLNTTDNVEFNGVKIDTIATPAVEFFVGEDRKMVFGYDSNVTRGLFYSDALGGGVMFFDDTGIEIGGSVNSPGNVFSIPNTWDEVNITGDLNVSGTVLADGLQFDQTPTTPAGVGVLRWNDTDGTLDLGVKGGSSTLKIGQQEYVRVVNKSGVQLLASNFQVVRLRLASEGGAQGGRLAVVLAKGDNELDSASTLGVVLETIDVNQEGFVIISGNIDNINTTGAKSYNASETWVDGDVLFLDPAHSGYLTKVKPSAPNHTVIVGWVVRAHATQGKLFVKVDNGYELNELHNVLISGPSTNQVLAYDGTLSVWKNLPVPSSLTNSNSIEVAVGTNPTTNGANLLAAYTAAKALTPNGSALSATNRASVFIPPALYTINNGTGLVLDAQYVDLVGIGSDRKTCVISNVRQTANDVRMRNLSINSWYPNTNLNMTQATDCVLTFLVDNYGTVSATISGTFSRCVFGVSSVVYVGSQQYSGNFTDCDFSGLGGASFTRGFSGIFNNCVSISAFSTPATGTYSNCSIFGLYETVSGTYSDCTISGFYVLNGTFTRCSLTTANATLGGAYFYCLINGYQLQASGSFKECAISDAYNSNFSGDFRNCYLNIVINPGSSTSTMLTGTLLDCSALSYSGGGTSILPAQIGGAAKIRNFIEVNGDIQNYN